MGRLSIFDGYNVVQAVCFCDPEMCSVSIKFLFEMRFLHRNYRTTDNDRKEF